MKVCKKCLIEKEPSEFYKEKKSKDGLRGSCKLCFSLYQKSIDDAHRKQIVKKSYYKNIDYKKKYYLENREKLKRYRINYHIINKELENEKSKIYARNNRGKITEYQIEYTREKMKTNPIFKLSKLIRSLINISFYNNGYTKKSKTYKIIGCSFEEFKIYIESKFDIWMNWDNHGNYTGNYSETWQLDHIIPISLGTTEEQIIELNHYRNFQPLCSKKNLEKSNNINSFNIKSKTI